MSNTITASTVRSLTDRIAAIVSGVDSVLIAARKASTPGDLFARVNNQSYYVQKDFLTPCWDFEHNLSGPTMIASTPTVMAMMQVFDSHTQSNANMGFDAYLSSINVQVSEYFARVYAASRGQPLRAHNVFAERDIVMARVIKIQSGVTDVSGVTSVGDWRFHKGDDLGQGGDTLYSEGPPLNTGEQILIAALPSGVSALNCAMRVSGISDNGIPHSSTFTFGFSGIATPQNQHKIISTTQKYRTIIDVDVISDIGVDFFDNEHNPVYPLEVKIWNHRERVIKY